MRKIEKLTKAIALDFIRENKSAVGNDAPLVHECIQYAFERIMSLPLADRLTDAEKERVRNIHRDYHQKWDCSCNDRDSERSFYCFSLLERIFGADFFKEEVFDDTETELKKILVISAIFSVCWPLFLLN